MRSWNKARLIDIAVKGLDPQKPHFLGEDGHLSTLTQLNEEKVEVAEVKETLNAVTEPVEELQVQLSVSEDESNLSTEDQSTASHKLNEEPVLTNEPEVVSSSSFDEKKVDKFGKKFGKNKQK